MKLAFIGLGTQLVRYFSQLKPYLLEENIESEFVITNPKVRSLVKRMGEPVYPLVKATQGECLDDAVLSSLMNPVISTRSKNLEKVSKRFEFYYAVIHSYFEIRKPDAVFLWNGYGSLESTAAYFARQYGVSVLYGENGYFPNTMQIDLEGVNQNASITKRINEELDNTEIHPQVMAELKGLINIFHSGRTWARPHSGKLKASLGVKILSELEGFSWERLRRGIGRNRSIPVDVPSLPEKYIFIPFQVESDSQLILHSPLIGCDMARFLCECYSVVQSVVPDYKLVVKLHPENLRRVEYGSLMKDYPDVLFLRGGSIRSLIEGSQAVITVNSTVGVEALTYHKPVVTLGESFYNIPGVVHHVSKLDDFPKILSSALSQPVNQQRVDLFLYYLYDVYFAHGSWKNYTESSYRSVASKMVQLLRMGSHAGVRI